MNISTKIIVSALLVGCNHKERLSHSGGEGYKSLLSYILGEDYNYVTADTLLLCIICCVAVEFLCWFEYFKRKRKEYERSVDARNKQKG